MHFRLVSAAGSMGFAVGWIGEASPVPMHCPVLCLSSHRAARCVSSGSLETSPGDREDSCCRFRHFPTLSLVGLGAQPIVKKLKAMSSNCRILRGWQCLEFLAHLADRHSDPRGKRGEMWNVERLRTWKGACWPGTLTSSCNFNHGILI